MNWPTRSLAGVLAALWVGAALPAAAQTPTTISCVSDSGASVDLAIAPLTSLIVLSAFVQADGQSWSSADGQLVAAQAFGDSDEIRIDFADPEYADIIVRLRLFRVLEGADFAMAGTLQIVGQGAYAVTCLGP